MCMLVDAGCCNVMFVCGGNTHTGPGFIYFWVGGCSLPIATDTPTSTCLRRQNWKLAVARNPVMCGSVGDCWPCFIISLSSSDPRCGDPAIFKVAAICSASLRLGIRQFFQWVFRRVWPLRRYVVAMLINNDVQISDCRRRKCSLVS